MRTKKFITVEDASFFLGLDAPAGAGAGFISTAPLGGGEGGVSPAGAGDGGEDAAVSLGGGAAGAVAFALDGVRAGDPVALEGGGAAGVWGEGAVAFLVLSARTTTVTFSFLRQLSLTPLMK